MGRPACTVLLSVAAVAQLVESQIVILVVAGSSPVGRPTRFLSPAVIFFRDTVRPIGMDSVGTSIFFVSEQRTGCALTDRDC